MRKVKWHPDKVIYFFDAFEPIFQANYFSFYSEQEKLDLNFVIHVNEDLKSLTIFGNFGNKIRLKVNDTNYLYDYIPEDNSENENTDKPKVKEEVQIEDEFEIVDNKYLLNVDEENIRIKSPIENNTFPVKIHFFTNENFPDCPYKKSTFKTPFQLIRETNVIYKVFINGKVFVVKDSPRYYWSNVKSLKEFIQDLQIELLDKTDEQLFKLIQEKSTYLKKRFGLDKEHVEDIEYFPLYKHLVNLYSVESLMSLSFINGNFITQGSENIGTASLHLGNFSTGQDGGVNGQIFSPQALKFMIGNAEKELKEALIKRAGIAYQTKTGGCCCVTNKRIRTKIQKI